MTNPLTLRQVYVEGDDDVEVLSRWFPQLQFSPAKGKDSVRSKVAKETRCYGLLDRDFATDDDVEASQAPGSRLVIMRRYAIENYLLEPDIVAAAVGELAPGAPAQLAEWRDEGQVRARILEWAAELALYAAANSIVSGLRDVIQNDQRLGFLRFFGPLPPLPRDEVVASLKRRLTALPEAAAIEQILDDRYQRVAQAVLDWDGAHCWIHGKVLLEDYLYPCAFVGTGLSQDRVRNLLIETGRERIPSEMQALAQRWAAEM